MNFRDLLEIPFKVDFKMHVIAVINAIDNILLLILVILMPFLNFGFEYFCIVYVASNVPGFLILLIELRKRFTYRFRMVFHNSKWLITQSLPLWGFAILIGFYTQFDILILNHLLSNSAAGIYGAAVRLTMPLGIIPVAVITTVFPIIMRNQKGRTEDNLVLIRLVNKILFFISFILALIFSFKSKEICILLFGEEFTLSYQPLIYLLWTYVFMFYNNFALDLFTAYDLQKNNIVYALIIVFVNILVLFLLVSEYSYNAAGFAKLISCLMGSFFIAILLAKKNLHKLKIRVKEIFWAVFSILVLYFISSLSIFIFIPLALTLILVLTIILSIFTKEEYSLLKNYFI